MGETMGLDEAQLRFATRLQTGEALVYSDEMAEAMHLSVAPQLKTAFPAAVSEGGGAVHGVPTVPGPLPLPGRRHGHDPGSCSGERDPSAGSVAGGQDRAEG